MIIAIHKKAFCYFFSYIYIVHSSISDILIYNPSENLASIPKIFLYNNSNILTILSQISQNPENPNPIITLHLTNNFHTINDKDFKENKLFLNQNKISNLTIQPLYCENFNLKPFCLEKYNQTKIKIIVKTRNFFFFVSGSLKIKGIIFEFSETIYFYNQADKENFNPKDPKECYNKKNSFCCSEIKIKNNDLCSLMKIKNLSIFTYAFIYLNKNSDQKPGLELINVEIYNLYTETTKNFGFNTLILALDSSANINLVNFTLKNSILTKGLMNYLNKSIVDNSFGEITLKNLSIIEFNILGKTILSENNIVFINILNFKGNIVIENLFIKNIGKTILFSFDTILESCKIYNLTIINAIQSQITIKKTNNILLSSLEITNSSFSFIIEETIIFFKNLTLFKVIHAILFTSKNSEINLKNCCFYYLEIKKYLFKGLEGSFTFNSSFVKNSQINTFLYSENIQQIAFSNNLFENISNTEFLKYSFFLIMGGNTFNLNQTNIINITIDHFIEAKKLLEIQINQLNLSNSKLLDHFFYNKKECVKKCVFEKIYFENNMIGRFLDITAPIFLNDQNILLKNIIHKNIIVLFISHYFFVERFHITLERNVFENITLPGRFLLVFQYFSLVTIKNCSFFNLGWKKPPTRLSIYDQSIIFTYKVYNISIVNSIFSVKNNKTQHFFIFWWIFLYETLGNTFINKITAFKYKSALSTSGKLVSVSDSVFENIECLKNINSIYIVSGGLVILGMIRTEELLVEVKRNIFQNSFCKDGGSLAVINAKNVLIEKNYFVNAFGDNGGHTYFKDLENLNISNTTFVNSSATEGGCLFLYRVNKVQLSFVLIRNIKSFRGAFYFQNVNLAKLDSLFVYNVTSESTAGFLYIKSSTVSLQNCFLIKTHAKHYAGAIFVSDKSNFFAENITIVNSLANYGGFIYIKGNVQVELFNIFIYKSIAKISGGALFIDFADSFRIKNVTIKNAESKAGNVYIKSFSEASKNVYFIEQLKCLDCFAKLGSCVFFTSSTESIWKDLSIKNCIGTLLVFSWTIPIRANFEGILIENCTSKDKEFIVIENFYVKINSFRISSLKLVKPFFSIKNSDFKILDSKLNLVHTPKIQIFLVKDSYFHYKNCSVLLETSEKHELFFIVSDKTQINIENLTFSGEIQSNSLFQISNAGYVVIKKLFIKDFIGRIFLIENIKKMVLEFSKFIQIKSNSTGFLINSINKNFNKNCFILRNIFLLNSSGIAFYLDFIDLVLCENCHFSSKNKKTKTKIFLVKNIKNLTITESNFQNLQEHQGTAIDLSSVKYVASIFIKNSSFNSLGFFFFTK